MREGIFLSRPNRFIAWVELDGEPVRCHVKNTGRCRELLVPGATVYLEEPVRKETRRTAYDLVAVQKGRRLINMDSQAPNRVAGEWLRAGGLFPSPTLVKPELRYGDSRFDFYMEWGEKRAFVEVKGVTLEEEGVALFPDAPSERALRHIDGLCALARQGVDAVLLLVIQMEDVVRFEPNMRTQPALGAAMSRARAQGVRILAYDCLVTPGTMELRRPVDVVLP